MKIISMLIAILFNLLTISYIYSLEIESIPIMHQGRISPLYSYIKKKSAQKSYSSDPSQLWIEHLQKTEGEAQSSDIFKMLPMKINRNEWLSLHLLEKDLDNNFTSFSDNLFFDLQTKYHHLKKIIQSESLSVDRLLFEKLTDEFISTYMTAYRELAGTPLLYSENSRFYFPTINQLQAELWHDKFPFINCVIILFAFSLLSFCTFYIRKKTLYRRLSLTTFVFAFFLLSLFLLLRIYILQRPPVSNMAETLLFVPWIACLTGSVIYLRYKHIYMIITAAITSFLCLLSIPISGIDSNLHNVQAVLNSNFWLTIHVLMIVSSYSLFLLSGLIGHFYLVNAAFYRQSKHLLLLNKYNLNTLYVAVTLLIAGTLLGAVWAAQSWGRFWDWDPKESWAFISACIYLICIHLYRYGKINAYGLACGSIIGLQAIIFTWYGVNYILGAGLHSYGFGSGGSMYFMLFALAENIFLIFSWVSLHRKSTI